MLTLDGSQGEGGGQILRTALTLSSILNVPFRLERIRNGRETPGLRPQHVAAVRAAASICDAVVDSVEVGSQNITFTPGGPVASGEYEWSVGTAGAASLVMQTVLLPLVLADGKSTARVHGGTHVPFSPSAHYLRDVYMPMLLSMGADVEIYIENYGWMPEGGGTICAYTAGSAVLHGLDLEERGRIERITGTAVVSNLPSHIPQRMANRAINLLSVVDAPLDIRPHRAKGSSTGAGIFLMAEYINGRGGFGVLGRKGMPSEVVSEKAVTALLDFHDRNVAVDEHLADQLVIPLALAEGPSVFTTPVISTHLRTNIDVVRAFVDRPITIDDTRHSVTFGT